MGFQTLTGEASFDFACHKNIARLFNKHRTPRGELTPPEAFLAPRYIRLPSSDDIQAPMAALTS